MTLRRTAVIGAGVMGAQIAAHMANAGLEVLLLDLVPPGAGADRDRLARTALERLARSDPPAFVDHRAPRRIRPGNLEDDLPALAACDWVVEAVVEDPAIKTALYRRLAPHLGATALLSTNTSTLPRADLARGLPADLAARFFVTHFFNPPRYMPLVELVAPPEADPARVRALVDTLDLVLGKTVVEARDTPGFVANRIGAFWIACAVRFAQRLGLGVEEADAVMGRPLGFPRTGVFGLIDLVGLDLLPRVDAALAARLPADDPYQSVRLELPVLARLVAEGYTGRKGRGGFYRRVEEAGTRRKEVLDLARGTYRPLRRVAFFSLEAARRHGPGVLLELDDAAARYARAVLTRTLFYAAAVAPDIAPDLDTVDRALEAGYNWRHGPFALADRLGLARLARAGEAEGLEPPPLWRTAMDAGGFYRIAEGRIHQLTPTGTYRPVTRPPGVLRLAELEATRRPHRQGASASVYRLEEEGVWLLVLHGPMNTLDPEVLDLLEETLDALEAGEGRGLVLTGRGEHFSAGANLALVLLAANVGAFELVARLAERGQRLFARLRASPVPVVAAPFGLTLGGGLELCLHAHAVVPHVEWYAGLVECGVGLVPAWGGCARLLARLATDPKRPKGPMPPVSAAFETIGTARVARSAFEARELGLLDADAPVVMNRDRLLFEAIRLVREGRVPRPRDPAALALPGPTGRAALELALHDLDLRGRLMPHDRVVAGALAEVLTGGEAADHLEPTPVTRVHALEREAFLRLLRTEATLARMEHTLETGRPLRN